MYRTTITGLVKRDRPELTKALREWRAHLSAQHPQITGLRGVPGTPSGRILADAI